MGKKSDILALVAMISQVGITMATPVIMCILIGHKLDEKFQTKVVFLLIFTVLGVGAAFRNLFVMGRKNTKKRKKEYYDE